MFRINDTWLKYVQRSKLVSSDKQLVGKDFIHSSGYKYKIRLVSILRKREDQSLISISTNLKFSALVIFIAIFISYRGVLIYLRVALFLLSKVLLEIH